MAKIMQMLMNEPLTGQSQRSRCFECGSRHIDLDMSPVTAKATTKLHTDRDVELSKICDFVKDQWPTKKDS